jgi:hypothetical protein
MLRPVVVVVQVEFMPGQVLMVSQGQVVKIHLLVQVQPYI